MASRAPFDPIELLGIAAGLVVVALFARHAVSEYAVPVQLMLDLAAAVAAIGPFILRRARRVGRHGAARAPGRA